MTLHKQKTSRSRSVSSAKKKRTALHHRRTTRYAKPYWPYLPVIAVLAAGLIASTLLGRTQQGILGYATNVSPTGLLSETNNQRAANGLGGLGLNGQLNQAAQAKANDMVVNNYWSHNSPSGATPWTFISNSGYSYSTAGENLAYGFATSSETIIAWMNSAVHRANILGSKYTEVGFGIANSANYIGEGPQTVVVAMYAAPLVIPPPIVIPAPQPAPYTPPRPVYTPPRTSAPAPAPAPATPAPAPAQPEPAPEQKPADTYTLMPSNATQRGDTELRQRSADDIPSRRVARVEVATKANAPWGGYALLGIALIAIVLFLLRHTVAWHRFLAKGEKFFLRHPVLDVVLVATAVLCLLLNGATGVIR